MGALAERGAGAEPGEASIGYLDRRLRVPRPLPGRGYLPEVDPRPEKGRRPGGAVGAPRKT